MENEEMSRKINKICKSGRRKKSQFDFLVVSRYISRCIYHSPVCNFVLLSTKGVNLTTNEVRALGLERPPQLRALACIPRLTQPQTASNHNKREMFLLAIFGFIGFAIGRVISLVVSSLFNQRFDLNQPAARTLVVLGSGGHTTEMLEIVKKLDKEKYTPRSYVVAESDQNSVDKLLALEAIQDECKIYMITRSRKVHQSFISSTFTTLKSLFNCIPLLMHAQPDLILCNGPATCVPVCLVAFFFKVFYINSRCKIAFVESFCRVRTLSLTGWILLYLSDVFVVQWPKLSKVSRKVLYFGRLT